MRSFGHRSWRRRGYHLGLARTLAEPTAKKISLKKYLTKKKDTGVATDSNQKLGMQQESMG
ncbi:MAG TPA: hypothetical protein DCL13_03900 [Peptococcaceae bacterium]|nr:hypothetical protein [Peptococcaceae bacterium]